LIAAARVGKETARVGKRTETVVLAGRSIRIAGMTLLLALGANPAAALDYPARPITLIVSHVPGGPSDVIARVLSSMLAHVLRQPLVIENRPGAGGNIAAEQAAHATADGYTLLMGNTNILVTNPARRKSASFDPRLDFTPITLLGTQANVLVVHPALPALSLEQLIELARARPGVLTFASSGHGSPAHLAGEMFRIEAKADLVHVPYKKPGPALQDVLGGHVQMMFAPAALVANHVRAGRLRAIAAATGTRNSLLLDVATIEELGHPGFDATTWYGLVAPAGTPKEIVDVLHHSAAAVIQDAAARKIMSGLGIDVVGNSPREFETYIKAQTPKWAAVIKSIAAHTH
jgi:tripartite-type tricarboxylate transporter receptor subunit TctC